jgi:hypothetical protein
VDVRYLALAKRVHDEAVARASEDWLAAVRVVAKELRVPDGVAVRLTEHETGVRMEWEHGFPAGDIKPFKGEPPLGVSDA